MNVQCIVSVQLNLNCVFFFSKELHFQHIDYVGINHLMRNIILLCFICLLSPKLAISEEPIVSWAGKMVIVSVPGNITHGDKMRFIFKEGRCHQVHHAFTIYTYVKESKLKPLENKIREIVAFIYETYTNIFSLKI